MPTTPSNYSASSSDAPQPLPEQEPVAWRYRLRGSKLAWRYVDSLDQSNPSDSYECEPVYGHPWLRSETPAIPEGHCTLFVPQGSMCARDGFCQLTHASLRPAAPEAAKLCYNRATKKIEKLVHGICVESFDPPEEVL